MAQSPAMNVMRAAVEKAGRALRRDFGEVENLQVSKKGPGDFVYNMSDRRAPEVTSKGGTQFKSLNTDSGRGLKIRSIKRK